MSDKNVMAETSKQPRMAFFLGAQMVSGWDLTYEDLDALATHTRSLVECFEVLTVMRTTTTPPRRMQEAMAWIGRRRDSEKLARQVGR